LKIESNSITVNKEISWLKGDNIYWRNQDTSPDAGAYEYNPEGYGMDIQIINPVDDGIINGIERITVESHRPEMIRFVTFYIDGIPVSQDFDLPYEYTWDVTDKVIGSSHTIEARAYALFASSTLLKVIRFV